MKKVLLLFLLTTITLSLVACGSDSNNPNTPEDNYSQEDILKEEDEEKIEKPQREIDSSRYYEIGETYGNLIMVKDENDITGRWHLIHSDNLDYYTPGFEKVLTIEGKVLMVQASNHSTTEIILYDTETGEKISELVEYWNEIEDTINSIVHYGDAIYIKPYFGGFPILINTKTSKYYHGVVSKVTDKNFAIVGLGNGDILLNLDTWEATGKYDEIGGYGDTIIFEGDIFRIKRGKYWGYVDIEGNTIIDTIYNEIGELHEGVIPVQYGENYGLINLENEFIIKPIYDEFIGYSYDNYKYLIFNRNSTEYSGCELVDYKGNVIIPENMIVKEIDGLKIYQEQSVFYVNEDKQYILGFDSYGIPSMIFYNLDGSIRFAHNNMIDRDYFQIGDGNEESLEKFLKSDDKDFANGPIIVSNRFYSGWSGNYGKYYFLYEDGTTTDEETYKYIQSFNNDNITLAKTTFDGNGEKFIIIDRKQDIIKDLGYECSQEKIWIYENYVTYYNRISGEFFIEELFGTEKLGPFADITTQEIKDSDTTYQISIVKDQTTNLYGIYVNNKQIYDTIYPEIKIDKQKETIVLIRGTNEEIIPFNNLFESFKLK